VTSPIIATDTIVAQAQRDLDAANRLIDRALDLRNRSAFNSQWSLRMKALRTLAADERARENWP
jgi:hypothetical protein